MPGLEDVWLVLAASDPNPQDALAYARKALEINPQSTRARRGIEWASGRLNQTSPSQDRTQPTIVPNQVETATSLPKKHAYQTAVAMPALKRQGRNWLLPGLLVGAGFLAIGFFALVALTSPVVASLVSSFSAAAPTQENLWAPAEIAKPAAVPVDLNAFSQSNTNNGSVADAPQSSPPLDSAPTATDIPTATQTPTEIPTEEPASTEVPAVTETPGSMVMEIVDDTQISESAAPVPAAPEYASGNGERWIDVDLTNQSVYAYEGDTVVNSFIVSTGTWLTPTVTGQYKIYVKIRSGNMHGPGYFLPDVPYIMYFYKGYGLHGTYWHHNFGTPMSHGCVNLQTDDAGWLFNWASVGTVVNVHY
jgi:lipoprotein-anchoring transpeptidase ErfK/SrfK